MFLVPIIIVNSGFDLYKIFSLVLIQIFIKCSLSVPIVLAQLLNGNIYKNQKWIL